MIRAKTQYADPHSIIEAVKKLEPWEQEHKKDLTAICLSIARNSRADSCDRLGAINILSSWGEEFENDLAEICFVIVQDSQIDPVFKLEAEKRLTFIWKNPPDGYRRSIP